MPNPLAFLRRSKPSEPTVPEEESGCDCHPIIDSRDEQDRPMLAVILMFPGHEPSAYRVMADDMIDNGETILFMRDGVPRLRIDNCRVQSVRWYDETENVKTENS